MNVFAQRAKEPPRKQVLIKVTNVYGAYGRDRTFSLHQVGHKTAADFGTDYLREYLPDLLNDVPYADGWYEPVFEWERESWEIPQWYLVLDHLKPVHYDRAAKTAYRATKPKS